MGGVAGVGLDIVSAARLAAAVAHRGDRFLDRLLSATEKYELLARSLGGARLAEYLAGRFAAKEAVAKAIGCGIGALGWRNVELISPDLKSGPLCRLAGHAAVLARDRGIGAILVSITHESGQAAACAIALAVDGPEMPEVD